jgi:hypothetical protein
MRCFNCRSEYRTSFTWRKDCDAALVLELTAAAEPEFVDFIEVLSIADAGEIPLIKSIREAEEIPYLA